MHTRVYSFPVGNNFHNNCSTSSSSIILYSQNVRDRLMEAEQSTGHDSKARMKGFLNGDDRGANSGTATPIADLFTHCTVFFGDIAGAYTD